MRPFKFRLQTSLDVAGLQEKMAREELYNRINRCDNLREQLMLECGRQQRLEQALRDCVRDRLPFNNIILINDYMPVIKAAINNLQDRLHQAEQKVEEARRALLEKVKATRTLEKLRAQAFELYMQEWNREEQKLIDEIAISRHFVNRVGAGNNEKSF